MTELIKASQSLTPIHGGLVTMFQLDATSLGYATLYNFTRECHADGSPIIFNGITYNQIDCEAEGFEWGGSGAAPTPTIKIINTTLIIGALVREYGDLVGATIRRTRTFKNFLDGQPGADPNMRFPEDVFRVERKTAHNKVFIEFELAIPLDQEGVMLPNRQCLRDTCTHIYRRWNGSAFDYSNVTCPYAGSAYFKRTGQSTAVAAEDLCGKRLSDCVNRFGNAPLPTRSFPGMQRYSQ